MDAGRSVTGARERGSPRLDGVGGRNRIRFLLPALALLGCRNDDDTGVSGDPYADAPIRSCDVVLETTAPSDVSTVQVAGRFNDWTPQDLEESDGVFAIRLGQLRSGTYAHKFLWDGEWEEVPPDVYTTWEDGVENRALVVPDCDLPDLTALSGEATADGALDATFEFTRAADGDPLDAASVEVTVGGEPVEATVDETTGRIEVSLTGLPAGKHSVRVRATDHAGRAPESGDAFLPLWVEDEPYAWQQGVLYYVFTDRFRDGDGEVPGGAIDGAQWGTDYIGGDLVGAREALEEGWFEDLGVTSIWLTPVTQNPDASYLGADGSTRYTGYHGYWPTDAGEIEDRWGTSAVGGDDALKEFIDAAHDRGIRIVFDVVLNHVHEDHTYLEEHPEWFTADPCVCTTDAGDCNWDTNPIGCWFTDYLPDLDYRNQQIVDRVVADTLWLIQEYDVDGLRVDAAKHMDHVIMRTIAMKLDERYEQPGGPQFYTVGETFTGQGGQGLIMDYVAPYELDGQFDFPLLYPIRNAVGLGYGWPTLADEVGYSDAAYGEHVHQMSVFMGNHDIERYATYVTGCDEWALFDGCRDVLAEGSATEMTAEEWDLVNRLATSYAFVATQPGVPLLYYGDEIGLGGAGDPDNRRPMLWGDELSLAQHTLLARVQELGQVRRAVPALHLGERRELWVDADLYVYARHTDEEVAIVALNIGSDARTEAVPVPTGLDLEGRTLVNALGTSRTATVQGGSLDLTLDPWEYVVLVP